MSCNLQTTDRGNINFDEKTEGKMGGNYQKLRENSEKPQENDVENSVRPCLKHLTFKVVTVNEVPALHE